jgi:ADP-heptose:LPS heptosyltransferase
MVRTCVDTLMIRPGALGDTLMMLPALHQLKGIVPVTVVGRRPGLDFISRAAERVVDMEGPGWHRLFGPGADSRGLPVTGAQHVVAFLRDQDGRIERNLKTYYPDARVFVFPSLPTEGTGSHAAFHIASCLKASGLSLDPQATIRRAFEEPLIRMASEPESGRRIVLHPGSGSPRKNHPISFWLRLVESLRREGEKEDVRITILFGPAEEGLKGFFGALVNDQRTEISICPSGEALLKILHAAALYVGHDSGITHLSSLLGTTTLALFRGTDSRQWRPLGPRVIVICEMEGGEALLNRVLDLARKLPYNRAAPPSPRVQSAAT